MYDCIPSFRVVQINLCHFSFYFFFNFFLIFKHQGRASFFNKKVNNFNLVYTKNGSNCQVWDFALSFFALLLKIALLQERSWAIRSPRSLKKEWPLANCSHRFFLKERPWANRSHHSLKKSDMNDLLMICSFAFKKRVIRSKKFVVFTMSLTVFHRFSPFYAQGLIASIALHSNTLF